MNSQMDIFSASDAHFRIDKPIRLIELFAGYGSQSLALDYLGADYEKWKICEWNYKSCHAYRLMHKMRSGDDLSEGYDDEQVLGRLLSNGISADWNMPMTANQIKHLGNEKRRKILSDIIATNNLVDISRVKASDLDIRDRDSHSYVMTYSFPCQDLSLAGKMAGMSESSGTRSSLLWQVGRILKECGENAPDVLLMENVPMVHGSDNREDFNKWINFLEGIGYSSFFKDLIATDYGIPQVRNRCFMVSIRSKDRFYEFPHSVPLRLHLKDLLEEKVDKKYLLTENQLRHIISWKERREGAELLPITDATKKGYDDATDGDGVYIANIRGKRGTVQHGKIQTLKAGGNDVGVVVCLNPRRSDGKQTSLENRIYDSDGCATSLTTAFPTKYSVGSGIDLRNSRTNENACFTLSTKGDRIGYCDDIGVRRLTPREFFRLMGVHDSEFDLIKDEFSEMTLYHLAGDSIVVNVLMAVFANMI